MGANYDTISPIKRAEIGQCFLADIQAENKDIDILIEEYIELFGKTLNKIILEEFLEELADLVTDPN